MFNDIRTTHAHYMCEKINTLAYVRKPTNQIN